VLWVREESTARPRVGPGWTSTAWTRMALTADGARVREIESSVIDVT
jgi:hypothetical protein